MALTEGEDAYIDIAYADSYWSDRNSSTWSNASQSEKEAAIRWATEELDTRYDWPGDIASYTQKLNWPRVNAYDDEGRYLEDIPDAVQKATAYLAGQQVEGNPIFQALSRGGRVKNLKAGSVEIEYEDNASARTVFNYVGRILSDIVNTNSSQFNLKRT